MDFNKEPIADRLLIVHLNINGLKKKLNWLKELAQEMKPGIICVSETNNPDINDVEIQGYKMCLKPNLDESILRSCGGVAIYVRNDLSAAGNQQPKTFRRQAETEAAWIEVTKAQSSIVVSVIYRAGQVSKLVRKSANPQLRTNEKSCGHADLRILAV